MSKSEEKPAIDLDAGALRAQTVTVVPSHEEEREMGLRSMTVGRYEEIRRRLAEGRGVREIARALGCARETVREVRDGERVSPDAPKPCSDPLWMRQLEWPTIIHDLGLGHPLKFVWEEKAQLLTTYPNFWKHYLRGFFIYRFVSESRGKRAFQPLSTIDKRAVSRTYSESRKASKSGVGFQGVARLGDIPARRQNASSASRFICRLVVM